ncbi:hypothetical protein IMZ16_08925 [Cruoricaptor ignavus]|uniref:Two component regulator propeller n=1 Tax=Cruoricaptor ignavus TaxID=1118202 RepID=A0A7M1T1F3_9FLAO|nr:two-component regulator propeller domain-containing protein [Cruoricaptor ignavus]QOR73625.1 hypothetical protein IMZ16_08925 [Cruoricaptor ignavus]
MRKVLISISLALLGLFPVSAQSFSKILFNGKKEYAATEQALFINKKGKLDKIADFGSPANDAIIQDNLLWTATEKGIITYSLADGKAVSQLLSDLDVTSLTKDSNGKIWASTKFSGIYKQSEKNDFTQVLSAGAGYVVCATPDGLVNAGTNLGLYSIRPDNTFIRYAEEAHSGYGLPDNYVEKLFSDYQSNLWIIMPDNIAFRKSGQMMGEMPSFAFVGSKENEIYNILNTGRSAFLFITREGVLLFPEASLAHEHHGGEVFNQENSPAFRLSADKLGTPKGERTASILNGAIHKNKLYLFNGTSLWAVNIPEIPKSGKLSGK